MKCKIKTAIQIFLSAVMILCHFSILAAPTNEEESLPKSRATVYYEESDSTLDLFNNNLSVSVDTTTGDFTVTHPDTGTVYYSNPENRAVDESKGINKFRMYSQLLITLLDKETRETSVKASYTGSVMREGFSVEKIDGGVSLVYEFPEDGVCVPLEILLDGDVLLARVDTAKIKEENSSYLVQEVGILPYFGSGERKEEGYLLIPDGSGALVDFSADKGNYRPYKQAIYGSDPVGFGDMSPSWDEGIRLPVYGIQRGENAFLAHITQGAECASLEAYTSGMVNEYNTVYASFSLYGSGMVTIGEGSGTVKESYMYHTGARKTKVMEVEYHLIPQGGGYVAMAQAYRSVLMQKGVTPSKQTTDVYFEFVGGTMKKESFLGFYVNRPKALTAVEDMKQAVEALSVPDATVIYSQWTKQQVNEGQQTKANLSSVLGSPKELKKLGDSLGEGRLLLSYEPLTAQKGVNRYTQAVRKIGGEVSSLYRYKPSTLYKDGAFPGQYMLKPDRVSEVISSFIKSAAKKYSNAKLYSETAGNMLYSDYDKKNFSSREDLAARMESALKSSEDKWTLKNANAYALPYAEAVTQVPVESSQSDIFTGDVPFYQLCMNGLIDVSVPAVNGSFDENKALMKALEYGCSLYFTFTCGEPENLRYTRQDGLYYTSFEQWRERTEAVCGTYKKALDQIGSKIISSHEKIDENVYKTVFDNGKTVLLNYGGKAFLYNEEEIPAGGYVIL